MPLRVRDLHLHQELYLHRGLDRGLHHGHDLGQDLGQVHRLPEARAQVGHGPPKVRAQVGHGKRAGP